MRPDYQTLLEWIKPEPPAAEDLKCMKLLKPGDYEIYSDRLYNYVLEGAEVFGRTGISEWIRSGDLIVGIHNSAGDIVCASVGVPVHAGTMSLPIKFVVNNYLDNPTVKVKEGDVFYANEATYGGIHNPDQFAFMPVFHDGELIAWTSACTHQAETGAVKPGGMDPGARTRYEEGFRVPPIKVGEDYTLRDDLIEMFANAIFRTPRVQIGDMKARFTACDRLRLRLQELAREKGNDFLHGLFTRTLKEVEATARKRIREWNDGTYRAVVFFDTAGVEHSLIRGFMTLHKREDSIVIDMTGTSPEHDGGSQHGLPHHVAAEAAFYLIPYIFHDLPITNAWYAPFTFIVPDGCVFSPSPEAAYAQVASIGMIVPIALKEIVAKMVFDSRYRSGINAATGGGSGLVFSGVNQYGVKVSATYSYQLNSDGQGARTDMDGTDAFGMVGSGAAKGIDVEDVEAIVPTLTLFQGLLRDGGGYGKYRGGAAVADAHVLHLGTRGVYVSTGRESKVRLGKGLFGGYPGLMKLGVEIANSNVLEKLARGDKDLPSDVQEMVTKRAIEGRYTFRHNQRAATPLAQGDIFYASGSSGAGYGDVLERDPGQVMADLGSGFISSWTVEHVYHVAYDPETLEADYKHTEELRQKARARRKSQGKRYEEFEREWLQKQPPQSALKHYGSWPDAKKVREIIRV